MIRPPLRGDIDDGAAAPGRTKVNRASFISRAFCRVVRAADERSEACAPHVPTLLTFCSEEIS